MDENNSSFSSQTKSLANIVNTVPTIILSQGYPKLYEIKMIKYGLQLLEKLELPHLSNKRNLTDDQLRQLYHLLIEDGFISKDTDEESFVWILGGRTKPLSIIATYSRVFIYDIEADSEHILEEGGFSKIKWIKYVNKTRGYNTSR